MDAPSSAATVHASCVSVGPRGVLIRGPSGSGKSHLAFALILAGRAGMLPETMLVADDRVHLTPHDERLVAAAPHNLAGLIEIRGAGLRRMPFIEHTGVSLVVDLGAADAARLPADEARRTVLEGFEIERLPLLAAGDALQQVLAVLLTPAVTD